MILNTIFAIFLPPFVGLYIQYKDKKHNIRQAFKRYLVSFFISNILTVLFCHYVIKRTLYFSPYFFILYSVISLVFNIIVSFVTLKTVGKVKFNLERKKVVSSKKEAITSKAILVCSLVLVGALIYYNQNFPYTTFEELFFAFTNGITGTSPDVIKDIFIYVFSFLFITYPLIYLLFFVERYRLYFYYDKKKTSIIPFKFFTDKVILRSIYVLIAALVISFVSLNIKEFYYQMKTPSYIYEENYIDPATANLSFPNNKKNLVYIILESMETSVFSLKGGGNYSESVVKELEEIAINNVSFKPNDNYASGFYVPSGCGWTAAALVCQSSGISLKGSLSFAGDEITKFLPGAYPLGNILEIEGYNLQITMGSNSSFNNRDRYFSAHGNYNILDLAEAKSQGYIPKDYHEWWGFEDSKLYEIAKKELLSLSSEDEPFAFTLLTADTHFTDGYLDETCSDIHDNQYLSVYSCASKMLSEFLEWLSAQEFYKDTVVVITGDHPSMQSEIFDNGANQRLVYNAIVNSELKPKTENRQASSFDIFPTILASIGVDIEGERLGLGTNLFSDKATLLEELGHDEFFKEAGLMSIYYNTNILNAPRKEK